MDSILTVVTPAQSQDLTTLATVKRELGIDLSDGSKNTQIAGWIGQASALIARHCNQVFGAETVSEQFRSPDCGYKTLILERTPVSSIASVVEGDTTLAASEYEIDETAGLLYRLSSDQRIRWPGCAKIVVTYTGGYALLDGLPENIERACIVQVKHYYFSATRDPLVKARDIPGVLRTEYWVGATGDDNALCPEALDLLERRPVII